MPKPGPTAGDAMAPARFSVTIEGIEIASFSQLVGIVSELELDDVAGMLLKRLSGTRNRPMVILKRGKGRSLEVSAWHEAALDGRASEVKKDAELTMYNTAGEPVARYQLLGAWVPKIEIGPADPGPGEVLYETVTISCERLQRVAV